MMGLSVTTERGGGSGSMLQQPPPLQEVSSERGFIRKERLRRPFRSWTPEQGKGEVTWKRVGHKKWPRIHTTIHAIGSMV